MAEKNQQFSERLKTAVNTCGVSQVDLSNELNIDKGSLNRYLNQGRVPEWHILVKLSDRLNISCDWLLTGKELEHRSLSVITATQQKTIKKLCEVFQVQKPHNLDRLLAYMQILLRLADMANARRGGKSEEKANS